MTDGLVPTNPPPAFIEADYRVEDSEPEIIISHPSNRELLRAVGNVLLEAKHHSDRLERIYDTLRTLQAPAPSRVSADLLDAYEQHHVKTGESLVEIRELVK